MANLSYSSFEAASWVVTNFYPDVQAAKLLFFVIASVWVQVFKVFLNHVLILISEIEVMVISTFMKYV